MKPDPQMFLKKIKSTNATKDVSIVRDVLSGEVTFKKGLVGRILKGEEAASARSHSILCKPGRALIMTHGCFSYSRRKRAVVRHAR